MSCPHISRCTQPMSYDGIVALTNAIRFVLESSTMPLLTAIDAELPRFCVNFGKADRWLHLRKLRAVFRVRHTLEKLYLRYLLLGIQSVAGNVEHEPSGHYVSVKRLAGKDRYYSVHDGNVVARVDADCVERLLEVALRLEFCLEDDAGLPLDVAALTTCNDGLLAASASNLGEVVLAILFLYGSRTSPLCFRFLPPLAELVPFNGPPSMRCRLPYGHPSKALPRVHGLEVESDLVR